MRDLFSLVQPDIAIPLACLLLVLLVSFVLTRVCRDDTWHERYPPISDEEFIARCTPGVNPEVALRVREIVATQLGIDYDRISPEMNFIDVID